MALLNQDNMRYMLKDLKHDVFQYKAKGGFVIIGNKTGLLANDEIIEIDIRDDFYTVNDVLLFNQNTNCNIFNIKNKDRLILENKIVINHRENDETLALLVDAKFKNQLYYLDLSENKTLLIIENYDWELCFVNYKTLFIYYRSHIKSINLDSGKYLWETDLSDYCKILSVSNEPAQGMIRQVFGVWGDKLWVGFDGNQYASLDLLTGKVLQYFKLEDIDEIFQEVNALSPYFDGNNGLLCFLENRIYAEINLNTLRVERKKNFVTDNTETDWNFSSNTFSESHVYFVATRTSSRFSPNYVGVFDRATMEVVWSKDLELYKLPPVKNMPARFLAQAPQSDGDKLYVLDTHGTLHVFEKIEENEYSQA
ncbi:hypothetical protein [Arcicella rigui]|uniref:Uncharacterized protein n=1 Tax=Arcicella rigui TaxID=797020 RepID=A0ABU5QBC7_9BACT|nr:hypothetical protein [Arcicella rigui]MEA5139659.1 hypothetical protein [Arcicella rigui]